MSDTTKRLSERDYPQVLQSAYNDVDATISTTGFLTGKVGHKIQVTYPDATSELYTFLDNNVSLYSILVTYTDSTKESLSTAERVS